MSFVTHPHRRESAHSILLSPRTKYSFSPSVVFSVLDFAPSSEFQSVGVDVIWTLYFFLVSSN